MNRPLCRHCGLVPKNRPRGLCWSCYYKPGVRELYPIHATLAQSQEQREVRVPDLPKFNWRNETPPVEKSFVGQTKGRYRRSVRTREKMYQMRRCGKPKPL